MWFSLETCSYPGLGFLPNMYNGGRKGQGFECVYNRGIKMKAMESKLYVNGSESRREDNILQKVKGEICDLSFGFGLLLLF